MRTVTCCLILITAMSMIQAADSPAVQFQPGCLAKIYPMGKLIEPTQWNVFKDNKDCWPITTLPDAPTEILRLPSLPTVEAINLDRIWNKVEDPSRLVESKMGCLRDVNYYAIEFEGYFLAPQEGTYSFTITSDDPVALYVEGNLLAQHTQAASPTECPSLNAGETGVTKDYLTDSHLIPSIWSAQGTASMTPNRWYHISLMCRQRWIQPARQLNQFNRNFYHSSDLNRGAVLRTIVLGPDQKAVPLSLSLPIQAKP